MNTKDSKLFLVPERVRELRTETAMTGREMSKRLGVSEKHLSLVLNGKQGISFALAERISQLLGSSAVYLLGLMDNERITSWGKVNGDRQPAPSSLTKKTTPRSDIKLIPIVSSKVITGACGPGTAYASEVEWGMEGLYPIPTEELSSYGWTGNSFKIMQAEGRSMEPEIYNGDKVLFVEGVEVGERDIVVISCHDRLFIKGIKAMNTFHCDSIKTLVAVYI